MYLKSIKACCAQAFATVLVIRNEISEKPISETYSRPG